jgi:hypothetical protein
MPALARSYAWKKGVYTFYGSKRLLELDTALRREQSVQCALVSSGGEHWRGTLAARNIHMSASHRPTDIHLRQHRLKKRNKLRARIAAAPAAAGRAALEAKVLRTHSPSHSTRLKLPPAVV